jgi:transposase
MLWSAQSPDLNPIENEWRLWKIHLNEYYTPPKGMNELWERTREVW